MIFKRLFFLILAAFLAAVPFVSASADPRDSESPFGVLDFLPWDHDWNAHHYDGDKVERAALLMKEAGVGFVRMDFLWGDIEREKGVFDFSKYDRIVDILTKHDLKILGILGYCAPWAGEGWNSSPDPAGYTEYARRTVERYKDRIKYWEVWNEPDHPDYWTPQDDLTAYTALLRRVYPVLKKEDPSCRVLLGGLSAQKAETALAKIYANNGKDSFDILDYHPFMNPLDPDAMKKVRQIHEEMLAVMREYGDSGKPVWWTEMGCPGVRGSKLTNEWWLGKNPGEKKQAEWVREVYGEPLQWEGIEKIFWAFFRDTPDHFFSGADFMGLLREDFSKKPAYEAYKEAASAAQGQR